MTDDEIWLLWISNYDDGVLNFARAIITIERERCAKVCSDLMTPPPTSDLMVAGANIALGEAMERIQK